MGLPWIKNDVVNKKDLEKYFEKARYDHDAISFLNCVGAIIDRINEAEEEKQKAQAKVKEYETSINADVRVKEIKAKYEEATQALYRGFGISKKEYEQIDHWKKEHDAKRHGLNSIEKRMRADGAIGGRYTYEFLPTSIGTVGTCVCGKCKQKAFEEAKGDREKYRELKKKYDAEFEFSSL
jgi:hypothetical protein